MALLWEEAYFNTLKKWGTVHFAPKIDDLCWLTGDNISLLLLVANGSLNCIYVLLDLKGDLLQQVLVKYVIWTLNDNNKGFGLTLTVVECKGQVKAALALDTRSFNIRRPLLFLRSTLVCLWYFHEFNLNFAAS